MKSRINIDDIPHSVKALLLDLDNTLYEYEPCHAYALKQCHNYFNKHIRKMNFEAFRILYMNGRDAAKKYNAATSGSRSRYLYFQRMFELENAKSDIRNTLHLGNIYEDSFIKKMEVMPWASNFLKHMRARRLKIIIVTNQQAAFQYRKIIRLGIDNFIDFVVTSDESGVEKPDAKIFHIALDKASLKPQDVIMIGDNIEEDKKGATNSGIRFMLCGS